MASLRAPVCVAQPQRGGRGGNSAVHAQRPPRADRKAAVLAAAPLAAALARPPAASADGQRRHELAAERREQLREQERARAARSGKKKDVVRVGDGTLTVDFKSLPGAVSDAAGSGVRAVKRAAREVQLGLEDLLPGGRYRSGGRAYTYSGYNHHRARQNERTLGWLSVAAAAGILWWTFGRGGGGRSRRRPPPPGKSHANGRWVKDRTLGGKEVWVPYGSGGSRDNPLGGGAPGGALSERAMRAKEKPAEAPAPAPPPSWWDPEPARYVSDAARAAGPMNAKAVLSAMTDAKVSRGVEFSATSLVALRRACAEGGTTVSAGAATQRDAVYRAGVEAAIDAATSGSVALLDGATPGRFVSALAGDLSVPQGRAVTMVHAGVAARTRGILVQAGAKLRQGDATGTLTGSLELGNLLQALPPGRGSAELDMVAQGVAKSFKREERQALLDEFSAAAGPSAEVSALVKEALGL